MAFAANFLISEYSSPNVFSLTDTSSESDPNLTGRTIYLRKADGNLLVPAITWAIGIPSITLDVLSTDIALSIEVNWQSSDPIDGATYTKKILHAFTAYGEGFNYRLIQLQSANPSIIQSSNYLKNKMELRVALDDARDAVSEGEDIFSAQQMLERANYLRDNGTYFY